MVIVCYITCQELMRASGYMKKKARDQRACNQRERESEREREKEYEKEKEKERERVSEREIF